MAPLRTTRAVRAARNKTAMLERRKRVEEVMVKAIKEYDPLSGKTLGEAVTEAIDGALLEDLRKLAEK